MFAPTFGRFLKSTVVLNELMGTLIAYEVELEKEEYNSR